MIDEGKSSEKPFKQTPTYLTTNQHRTYQGGYFMLSQSSLCTAAILWMTSAQNRCFLICKSCHLRSGFCHHYLPTKCTI